ncbi:IclR family transcriptional regulator [Phaeobacter marinintestinus]|uniref:IclR family transcriptional regulator n=1 Tax=Falsiphaeobacter marinintestinus TaxID=1492905 RepID=UPI0011B367B8|nr:IclR family transcriptional regulator [Phaeobacter marinintestinus]
MNKQASGDGTVGKALDILDMVAEIGRPVRFSDLLEQSPHPKATLYRFLQTLTNQGMLKYDGERQTYSLGLRLVRLAHQAWAQSSLAPLARLHLEALAVETGETIHLAQMENGQVLFIDKCRSSNRFDTLAQAGRIAPAHCTGVGKAILAHLTPERFDRAMSHQTYLKFTSATHDTADGVMAEFDQIRAEGVAYDREEHEDGIISIAAPIFTQSGRVIGAISIVSSTSRRSLEDLTAFKPQLIETAGKIGAEASAWQFPS